jgi:phage terminase large subunit-like protein
MDTLNTIADYRTLFFKLENLPTQERRHCARFLCRTDLFFLLWYGCGRKDIEHPWLLERCKEVQEKPDECLDLWARGHYKSTIITFGKTIQDILASHGENPLSHWGGLEPTFGIFSCTRPIAKGFLRQIKRELESNPLLKDIFSDVLWAEPHKEAPKWSEDDGLVVKRNSNPKESTVEAWGVVEGQPTSKHFNVLVFDDLVTIEYVRSPLMIEKTSEALALADNLGAKNYKKRIIGTRYHFNDTYRDLISKGEIKVRKHAATDDATPEGKPVFLDREEIEKKRRIQGPYVFACQMLLNPLADETQGFKREWLKFYKGSDGANLNRYILVDPAGEKKKTSDYTAICVVGLGIDNNYYLLDMVRDRLNLLDRADALFRLHRKWRPLKVGYEKYGKDSDIQYLKEKMHRETYHFNITEMGGAVAKNDRIKGLIPSFSERRWYFPDNIFKTNYEGRVQDLVEVFINEEYLAFPVPVHDDMMDCMARILDPDLSAIWPRMEEEDKHDYYGKRRRTGSSWAA